MGMENPFEYIPDEDEYFETKDDEERAPHMGQIEYPSSRKPSPARWPHNCRDRSGGSRVRACSPSSAKRVSRSLPGSRKSASTRIVSAVWATNSLQGFAGHQHHGLFGAAAGAALGGHGFDDIHTVGDLAEDDVLTV